MKRYLAGASALLFLTLTAPALAQDRDYGHGDYNNGTYNDRYRDRDDRNFDRDGRRYYRDRRGHAWHEGDTWQGHRLVYDSGRWGYWQPRGGTRFFVQFSL